MGAEFFSLGAGEETDAERGALVGATGGAGVEEVGAVVHFVGGTVGVAEEKPVVAGHDAPGQDVNEMEAFAIAFEVEADGGIETEIVVAEDDGELGADDAQLIEDRFGADIAEVPDLIDAAEKFGDAGHPAVVGVGDNADAIVGRGSHMS